MSTPAEMSREARVERGADIHRKAAEGAIRLRIEDDWIEYYNTEKKQVFYFCTSSNYRTMNRERTPFKTPARPELGPMPDFDENAGQPAFVPQKKFVSKLLSTADGEVEEIGDGAAHIIRFRDHDREKVEEASRVNKRKDEERLFMAEQRRKQAERDAAEAAERRKRKLEEDKEKQKEDVKRRRGAKLNDLNDKMMQKWGKGLKKKPA